MKIAICILSVLLITTIILLILSFKKQREYKEKISSYSNYPELTLDNLEFNRELLSFIDTLIENEIINEKRFDLFLDQKNKNIDVDKVIKDVSTRVFSAIKPEVYVDSKNIITDTYIMSYIQKKTFIICMMYIQNNVASQLQF